MANLIPALRHATAHLLLLVLLREMLQPRLTTTKYRANNFHRLDKNEKTTNVFYGWRLRVANEVQIKDKDQSRQFLQTKLLLCNKRFGIVGMSPSLLIRIGLEPALKRALFSMIPARYVRARIPNLKLQINCLHGLEKFTKTNRISSQYASIAAHISVPQIIILLRLAQVI
ncbi:MAG: hypothetical protein CVU32_00470 [Betaproteobacteria bacterium HGW-Betaproteobacteria-5]|nr:MAG: hypothetical protein CVU32_00470 [Betaproteobacteria bacterium HGW-Betaproteobacteria-5]